MSEEASFHLPVHHSAYTLKLHISPATGSTFLYHYFGLTY